MPRAACLFALLLLACGAEETVKIDQTREVDHTARLSPGVTTAERLGLARRASPGHVPGHAPAAGTPSPGYAWDLPDGWKQLPPARFRDGNFGVGDDRVDCYLSILPAGGGMAANLDRWRGQMGLPAMSKEEFDALEGIPVLGRNGVLVDLDGSFEPRGSPHALDGYRMLGVIVEHEGRMVTLKMVGPADVVAGERGRFLALCRSLRAEAPRRGPSSEGSAGLSWSAPDGWREKAASRFRLVTFVPKDDDRAECYLTVAVGDAKSGVDRWRGEMGKPGLSEAGFAALPEVEVLGRPSRLVEVAGTYSGHMRGSAQEGYMLLGVVCELDRQSLFAKMIGPEETVRRERDNFIKFVKSIH